VKKTKPSLILKNGLVYSVDQDRSWAQGVVISDGRIVYVGSNEGLEPFVSSSSAVIDLNGKMVLPGFSDAHAHPSHAMDYVENISLYQLDSIDAYLQAVREYAEKRTDAELLRGSGWDNRLFSSRGPEKELLDDLAPDKLVALVSYDVHSTWVNSFTLDKAGITKATPDPEGGYIERDPDTGDPSGTLRESAMRMVDAVVPDYSIEERKRALLAYQEMAARCGVTLSHDAMLEPQSISAFREMEAEGSLSMRFHGSLLMEPEIRAKEQVKALLEEQSRNRHSFFQVSAAKIFVDGVIEGGTAYLHEPYKHKPDFRGEPIWSPEILNNMVAALDKENIQIHFHVIGDAATEITLDALENALRQNGKRDSRHLITHLQLVTPKDIARFGELGIVGVPQPFWFKVDEYYEKLARPYLGKARADVQYPMKSFIESGVIMASASDFPVTIQFDPLIGVQIGMTRSLPGVEPEVVLWRDERATLDDMIASFTINGAYANFIEHETGSLEVGKRADVIVLDQNLFDIPPAEISQTRVLLTLADGVVVFRDTDFEQFSL
jgi:predicted amidohydrolase YtcJ